MVDNVVEEVVVTTAEKGVSKNASAAIVPINTQNILAHYSDEQRAAVMALADRISLSEPDKIMHYGGKPIEKTMEQAERFLASEKGSSADREIMKRVQEYSADAQKKYDDFQSAIKEPNALVKKIMSIVPALQRSKDQKVTKAVKSASDLIISFKEKCDLWLDSLRKAAVDIQESGMSDVEVANLLEEYIIAGEQAEGRLAAEVEEARRKYEATGSAMDAQIYQELKDNFTLFKVRMDNLRQSRAMYDVSVAQLTLIKQGNRSMQAALETQRDTSISLMSQQMRNGMLSYKTQEVRAGQQAMGALNSAIVRDISKRAGETAEKANQQLYTGLINLEDMKESLSSFVKFNDALQSQGERMLAELDRSTEEITKMAETIKNSLHMSGSAASSNNGSSASEPQSSTASTGGLEF